MNLEDNKENNENNKAKLTIKINQNNESNKNTQNNTKININTKLDLNKIPLKTFLHENLNNFGGDYFKKLYDEAVEEEKKELQNEYKVIEEIILPNKSKIKDNTEHTISVQHPQKEEEKDDNKKQNEENKEKKEEEDKKKNEENKDEKKNKANKAKKQSKKITKIDNELKEVKSNKSKIMNNNTINKKSPTNISFKIDIIYFEIKYDTQMGESMAIIGSNEKLGCWDTSRALHLNWNEGNIWRASFEYNEINDFEYKFIFIENGNVKEWENGINRKFIYQQIKSLIEPNLAIGNIIKLRNIMYQSWEYDYNNYSLKIISEWNKK